MTNITQLHKPRWQQDGDNWLMIVGNHAVAAIIANYDERLSRFKWLSLILAESDVGDFGWHGVDFSSVGCGPYDLEQWWHHASRGERYNLRLHRNCPAAAVGAAVNFEQGARSKIWSRSLRSRRRASADAPLARRNQFSFAPPVYSL
jgi:hypothetical protein